MFSPAISYAAPVLTLHSTPLPSICCYHFDAKTEIELSVTIGDTVKVLYEWSSDPSVVVLKNTRVYSAWCYVKNDVNEKGIVPKWCLIEEEKQKKGETKKREQTIRMLLDWYVDDPMSFFHEDGL
jgi:hypothetical protein